jgi:riboflavin kinase/FMN adenylyltransferase
MQVIRHFERITSSYRGASVALGNFDGVHRGHRAVIGAAAEVAHRLGVPLGVLVFEPHPQQYFAPQKPFARLTPFRAKARLLERLGVDVIYALPFDAQMAVMDPTQFVIEVLVNGLHAIHLAVGYDFRFGRDRAGDAAALAYMGEMEGVGVTIVAPVAGTKGEIYSSTRIRDCLAMGDVEGAARLLGHWWTVDGRVVGGDKRGRIIGFPTINIPLYKHVPLRAGVYAVRLEIEDGPFKGVYDGVANVGHRPTFDPGELLLEVYIFDFSGALYGAHVDVSFIAFLRDERKFTGIEALKSQIVRDVEAARLRLSTLGAARVPFEGVPGQ